MFLGLKATHFFHQEKVIHVSKQLQLSPIFPRDRLLKPIPMFQTVTDKIDSDFEVSLYE